MSLRLKTLLLLAATGCADGPLPWSAPEAPRDRLEPLALAPAAPAPAPAVEAEPGTRPLRLRVAGSRAIQPGDRVDVLVMRAEQDGTGKATPRTRFTNQDVRVQSIGPVEDQADVASGVRDAVLLVPDVPEDELPPEPMIGLPTLAARGPGDGEARGSESWATVRTVLTGERFEDFCRIGRERKLVIIRDAKTVEGE